MISKAKKSKKKSENLVPVLNTKYMYCSKHSLKVNCETANLISRQSHFSHEAILHAIT